MIVKFAWQFRGNNEPWFIAKDVCEVLGYMNPRKAVADHCKTHKK
jgi:prophage antirepressor-like protein